MAHNDHADTPLNKIISKFAIMPIPQIYLDNAPPRQPTRAYRSTFPYFSEIRQPESLHKGKTIIAIDNVRKTIAKLNCRPSEIIFAEQPRKQTPAIFGTAKANQQRKTTLLP